MAFVRGDGPTVPLEEGEHREASEPCGAEQERAAPALEQDRARDAWWPMAFLGGCVLLPYNCLLQAQAYFDEHPMAGRNFPFLSMIAYSVWLCGSQMFLSSKGEQFTINGRMQLSFLTGVLVCGVLMAIPIASRFEAESSWCFLAGLAAVAVLGLSNALMQSSLMGLAGTMGPDMSQAAMFGFGACGILSLVLALSLSVVERAAGVNEQNGASGTVVAVTLFAVSIAYTIASVWMYKQYLCERVPRFAAVLKSLEVRRESFRSLPSQRSLAAQTSGRSSEEPAEDLLSAPQATRISVVLWEIAPQALNVFFTFAVTMSVFPGVMLKWAAGPGSLFIGSTEFFGMLLTGTFQIFDLIGRSMAGWAQKCVPRQRLWFFVTMRFAFVPLFMLGQRRPIVCVLWGSDVGRFLLVALLATTNGCSATLAMMFGPQPCPEARQEVAGIAMSCTMVSGIFAGTLFGLLTQFGV